ncbi:MAG TPA: hypothetical protein DCM57_06710 [Treponema sp.]|nr:hypothetical protein [Treponema sp.]
MRVQSDFSNSSGFLIRKSFGIAREEPLICGMWLHFQRHGFVFTENGLHWNLPTAISVPGNSENHFETGVFFIHGGEIPGTTVALKLKDGSIYDWQRYKIAKKKPRPEFLILTQGGIERCVKLGHMDIDDAQKLRRILIEYVARGRFPYEYLSQSPIDTLSFLIDSFVDFFNAKRCGYSKSADAREGTAARTEFIGERNRATDISSYFSARMKRRMTPFAVVRQIFRYGVDIIADLVFVASMLVGLKPVLLHRMIALPHTSFSDLLENAGSLFFFFDHTTRERLSSLSLQGNIIDSLLYRRSQVFILLLGIFVILKLVVIFISLKGSKKIIPLVILTLTLCSIPVLPNHLGLFVAFNLLLYFLMQFSLGFDWINTGYKMLILFLLIILEYYFIHLFCYPNFVDYITVILQMLRLKPGVL